MADHIKRFINEKKEGYIMRPDYQTILEKESVNKLLDLAIDNNEFDCFEGTLLDNYIIYNTENLRVGKVVRKFIILKEKYLNCWSSVTEMIMTDYESTVDEFKRLHDKEEIEL